MCSAITIRSKQRCHIYTQDANDRFCHIHKKMLQNGRLFQSIDESTSNKTVTSEQHLTNHTDINKTKACLCCYAESSRTCSKHENHYICDACLTCHIDYQKTIGITGLVRCIYDPSDKCNGDYNIDIKKTIPDVIQLREHNDQNDQNDQNTHQKIRSELEDALSAGIIRVCPNCRIEYQKTEGCNHITCLRCRLDFCHLCYSKEPWQTHFNGSDQWSRLSNCPLYGDDNTIVDRAIQTVRSRYPTEQAFIDDFFRQNIEYERDVENKRQEAQRQREAEYRRQAEIREQEQRRREEVNRKHELKDLMQQLADALKYIHERRGEHDILEQTLNRPVYPPQPQPPIIEPPIKNCGCVLL